MAAVTASTKTDSPKMDLAGVETGSKMFVGLIDGAAGSVAAAAAVAPQKTTWDIWNTPSVSECFVPRIVIESLVSSLGSFPDCHRVGGNHLAARQETVPQSASA